jgi:hypothetical protein
MKQFCINGHDKEILGRTKDRHCAECTRISVREWSRRNKEKVKLRNRLYSKNNPNRQREISLRRYYGITLGEYNRLFLSQNGCCAICNIHQSLLKKRLFVDHDHTTKEIRGLLCSKCNFLIGQANDSPTLLTNAIKYLT